jgi:uncharacterized protein
MKRILKAALSVLFLLFLCIPVRAEDNTDWVQDNAGILTSSESEELSSRITELTDTYNVGIYLYTVSSRSTSDIETYAEEVYTSNDLGLGTDSDGILLILDFSDRSYDIAAYGSTANTCFTDYAKNRMEDAMLDYFGNDNWYKGYQAFLDEVETDLYYGITENNPVDVNHDPMTLAKANKITIFAPMIVSPLIALAVCLALASKNRTAGKAVSAAEYSGTLNLSRHDDIYTHTTRQVVHIPRSKGGGGGGGGGGTSVGSSGFSHSSGHF